MNPRRLVPLAVLAPFALRPLLARWGSTAAERHTAYPGDELIADPLPGSTMATTLPAPPEDVWPWLIQMGADRAGFYSWDRLDNGGRASATRVHPEWQGLRAGDRVAAVPDGSIWFDVAAAAPPRTLVLRTSVALPSGRPFDRAGPAPRAHVDGLWAFHLRPLPDGRTRLVVRGRGTGHPRWLVRVTNALFSDPAHWIMQTRQFRQLRRRVRPR